MTTTIDRKPGTTSQDQEQKPLLFQVWIDLTYGSGEPDWWWNTPPKLLADALEEAANLRVEEWVCKVMPEGMNPRPDGRWDNP